ncbi:MAG: H/ACA ribonucleoprotein complex subunit GAR1 [Promethearchaeota archaeon]
MKWLGLVTHVSSMGKLIIQSDFTPPLNALVLTENERKAGTISDVFGPVKKPYISITPSIPAEDAKNLVGAVLYLKNKEKNNRRRPRRRKKF